MKKVKNQTILLAFILLAGMGLFFWFQFQIFEKCLENEYERGYQDGLLDVERGYCDGYWEGRFDMKNQPEIIRCEE